MVMIVLVSSGVMSIGLPAFAIIIGAVFLYQAYKGFSKKKKMKENGVPANAEVISYKSKKKKSSSETTSTTYYAPVYRFENQEGEEEEVTSDFYTRDKKHNVGDHVGVKYYKGPSGDLIIHDDSPGRLKMYRFMASMGTLAFLGGAYFLIKHFTS